MLRFAVVTHLATVTEVTGAVAPPTSYCVSLPVEVSGSGSRGQGSGEPVAFTNCCGIMTTSSSSIFVS
jgi:hypothetical protein